MNTRLGHNNTKSSSEVHQKYRVDHIQLPDFHPDPLKSIELQQKIYDLVRIQGNIFYEFEKFYNSLELEEQYFLLQYGLEYLYPNTYYTNYLQSYFEELALQSEDNATVLHETSTERVILNDNSLDYFEEEVKKTEQAELIIDFIREELPFTTHKLKLQYRDKLQGQDYLFAPEHFAVDKYQLDPKMYRVNVPVRVDEFLNKVREELQEHISSEQIDAFIYNSFQFPSNLTTMEILSLDFGNSVTTNTLIHRVYLTYKDVVMKKTSRFDFAKIMYLNFEFVRNNWEKYREKHQNDDDQSKVIREYYLKTRVASNIEK